MNPAGTLAAIEFLRRLSTDRPRRELRVRAYPSLQSDRL